MRGPAQGHRRLVLPLVTAAILLGLAAAGDAQPRPADPAARVYLVPLGAFPSERLTELVAYYKARLGLAIQTLPPLSLERAALDYGRQQLIAEECVAALKRRLPALGGDPRAIIIGLTTYDLYIRAYTWQWAFAFRQDNRLAVVSIARMDPANWGEAANADQLRTRLRKMVSKNLGLMYYGLPESSSRSSVLYGPILGLDDLDGIGESF